MQRADLALLKKESTDQIKPQVFVAKLMAISR
jgi:hypothetical protein